MFIFKKIILCAAAGLCVGTGVFAKSVVMTWERVELRETYIAAYTPYRTFITYAELQDDIESLVYYLKTAYAGYDEMKERGFKAELVRAVLKNYEGQKKIESRKVFFDLQNTLRPYVKDMHFFIKAWNDISMLTPKAVFYYANVFVQKTEDGYKVCQSGVPSVMIDSKFTGSEENLFYYPVKGENVYRLGVIADKKTSFHAFDFDGKSIAVPVYDDGAIESLGNIKFREIETADSAYVSISSFMLPPENSQFRRGAEIIFKKYVNLGIQHRNKKNIIIDLRGNDGGVLQYSEYLFYSMTQKNPKPYERDGLKAADTWASENFSMMMVESPATHRAHILNYELLGTRDKTTESIYKNLMKNPARICSVLEFPRKENPCFYDGRIVILIDRNTMSASEEAVFLAKKAVGADKVFVVGENSGGCFEYVDILDYALPNSGIYLHLADKKITSLSENPQWHGEGFGIYPDYWAVGADLNDTIFMITHDEELKEKLPSAAAGFDNH